MTRKSKNKKNKLNKSKFNKKKYSNSKNIKMNQKNLNLIEK